MELRKFELKVLLYYIGPFHGKSLFTRYIMLKKLDWCLETSKTNLNFKLASCGISVFEKPIFEWVIEPDITFTANKWERLNLNHYIFLSK